MIKKSASHMEKLKRIQGEDVARLEGYLDAAQLFLFKGQLDLTLKATLFAILDPHVVDEDALDAAYPKGFNPIESRVECTASEMISYINGKLTLSSSLWNRETARVRMIEDRLRQNYWAYIGACLDYKTARIVKVGPHVPFVNISGGFTYILYAADFTKCLLLVGTSTD